MQIHSYRHHYTVMANNSDHSKYNADQVSYRVKEFGKGTGRREAMDCKVKSTHSVISISMPPSDYRCFCYSWHLPPRYVALLTSRSLSRTKRRTAQGTKGRPICRSGKAARSHFDLTPWSIFSVPKPTRPAVLCRRRGAEPPPTDRGCCWPWLRMRLVAWHHSSTPARIECGVRFPLVGEASRTELKNDAGQGKEARGLEQGT